jgi:hypothetical protein
MTGSKTAKRYPSDREGHAAGIDTPEVRSSDGGGVRNSMTGSKTVKQGPLDREGHAAEIDTPEVRSSDGAGQQQGSVRARLTSQDGRTFILCPVCELIYCDPAIHLDIHLERDRYDTHQNNPKDESYLRFLRQVVNPVGRLLKPGFRVLDYGSGPGPALGIILKEYGIEVELFDPIYAPEVPEGSFDAIFSTETFEHFHHPKDDLLRLSALLKPGGLLSVMTEQWTDIERFSSWNYTRDDTHVCFYHARTFDWIARQFGYRVTYNDARRVVCLTKNEELVR